MPCRGTCLRRTAQAMLHRRAFAEGQARPRAESHHPSVCRSEGIAAAARVSRAVGKDSCAARGAKAGVCACACVRRACGLGAYSVVAQRARQAKVGYLREARLPPPLLAATPRRVCESTKPSSPACTVVPVAATPVRRGLCACVASPEKCVRSTGSDEHWHGGSRAEAVADLGAEAVFGLEVAVQPLRVREESARGTCCAARTVSSVRAAAKATRQRRRELSPFGLLLRAGAPRGPITSARCTVLSERWRVVKQYGLLGVLSFG